jgi:hypothetical protein
VIKTIFTTVIVLTILNAVGHLGMAAWRHFQVRDQAQQLILFGSTTSTKDLEYHIAQVAEEFEVPIAPEDIVVTRTGPRTIAEAYYTMPVEVFPRIFFPIDLSFMVESFAITGATPTAPR